MKHRATRGTNTSRWGLTWTPGASSTRFPVAESWISRSLAGLLDELRCTGYAFTHSISQEPFFYLFQETLINLILRMVRQAHHERNQKVTVHPELVEGSNQRLLMVVPLESGPAVSLSISSGNALAETQFGPLAPNKHSGVPV